MSNSKTQLGLSLQTPDPYASRYFVPHSGVSDALEILAGTIDAVLRSGVGSCILVSGERGVGKTHFLHLAREQAEAAGIHLVHLYDEIAPANCQSLPWCSKFVADYQEVLGHGGLLLCASNYSIAEIVDEPSVLSRLAAAERIVVRYPSEEELVPVIESIAERRNFQLNKRKLDYIIRRLPRNPLSFENLFDSIDQLCVSSGEPAKLKMFRSILSSRE